jgi:hypothetical protein
MLILKNTNSQIAFFTLLLILTSILLIYSINDWYRIEFDSDKWQEVWYSQNFPSDEKRIYLIGSSHVGSLNATHVQKVLAENNYDFEVYNLATSGDRFQDRLKFKDMIISTQPKIIVLGFGYRDFILPETIGGIPSKQSTNIDEGFPKPDILEGFSIVLKSLKLDLDNFQNPKLTTLMLIELFQGKTPKTSDLSSSEPFEIQFAHLLKVETNEDKLKEYYRLPFYANRQPDYDNPAMVALKEFISESKKNNIDVIVFITPAHQILWNAVSETNQNYFISSSEQLSEDLSIPVYDLHKKYSELEIWSNLDHVSKTPEGLIYSEDIAKFIIKEYGS